MCSLLLTLKRHFYQSSSAQTGYADYVQERIRTTLEYIEKNYTRKVPLQEISQVLGLNPQYFSAFFSQYFHRSFIDYLNEHRINNSLSELCCGDKNITQIAFDHGFQTYKSYSNAFQKLFHMSPSAYRSLGKHVSEMTMGEVILHRVVFRFINSACQIEAFRLK